MAKTLRVGMIGTGGIAQAHLAAWDKLPNLEIAALCDIRPEALKTSAERWCVAKENCFTDYRQMLEQAQLDLVDICTPNALHAPPTIAAFAAGCHAMVEKPAATSARELEKMIAAGHAAGKLLMIAQVARYSREALTCRHWVDQGLLGNVYWGRAEYLRRRGVPPWGAFIDRKASAGGPVYDIGVHVLDLALHLMDFPEPATVSAGVYLKLAHRPSVMRHNPRKYTVPEDFATALVRFADGRTLSLGASWALNLKAEHNEVFLCGEKGGLSVWPPTLISEEHGLLGNTEAQVTPYDGAEGFVNECSAFAEAIRGGKPSPVPGEQALITQRILDAVYKSGERGREVKA